MEVNSETHKIYLTLVKFSVVFITEDKYTYNTPIIFFPDQLLFQGHGTSVYQDFAPAPVNFLLFMLVYFNFYTYVLIPIFQSLDIMNIMNVSYDNPYHPYLTGIHYSN